VAQASQGELTGLDAFLPSYEFAERHSISVDADPEGTDRAVREVRFRDVPLLRALLLARGLGAGGADESVLAAMARRAEVLEDVPGRGIVLSLRGEFWRLRGSGGDDPQAVAVVDFRAEAGRLTTETRVHVADPVSRRKFARYWRVIRPFSGLTRILMLRAAKRRAERLA
jgi:hypothetical protein